MITTEFCILLAAAALIAMLSGAFGIGGGTLTVPFLIFMGSLSGWKGEGLAHTAIAISLLTALLLSVSASASNVLSRRIHFIPGLIVSAFSLPGSYLGVTLSQMLDFQQLALIFAVIVILTGLAGFFRKSSQDSPENGPNPDQSDSVADLPPQPMENSTSGRRVPDRRYLILFAVSGLFVGILSAITGLGGGVVLVPLFLWFLPNANPSEAVATSSFCIVFSAFYGSVLYALQPNTVSIPEPFLGHYYLPFAIPFAIGALAGGFGGALLKNSIKGLHLKRGFAIVQVLAGLSVLIRAL
ncbi:MAG: sulfite exporter TauE/SafE family protein [Leptospiraceae bacterium]|nr:sulfite exporter TauE/SafE family protein [Leptospiraceae bacterium]